MVIVIRDGRQISGFRKWKRGEEEVVRIEHLELSGGDKMSYFFIVVVVAFVYKFIKIS